MTTKKEHKEPTEEKKEFQLNPDILAWVREWEVQIHKHTGDYCIVIAENVQRAMEARGLDVTKDNCKMVYKEVR